MHWLGKSKLLEWVLRNWANVSYWKNHVHTSLAIHLFVTCARVSIEHLWDILIWHLAPYDLERKRASFSKMLNLDKASEDASLPVAACLSLRSCLVDSRQWCIGQPWLRGSSRSNPRADLSRWSNSPQSIELEVLSRYLCAVFFLWNQSNSLQMSYMAKVYIKRTLVHGKKSTLRNLKKTKLSRISTPELK